MSKSLDSNSCSFTEYFTLQYVGDVYRDISQSVVFGALIGQKASVVCCSRSALMMMMMMMMGRGWKVLVVKCSSSEGSQAKAFSLGHLQQGLHLEESTRCRSDHCRILVGMRPLESTRWVVSLFTSFPRR